MQTTVFAPLPFMGKALPKTIRILMVDSSPGDVHLMRHLLGGVASDCDFEITPALRLIDAFKQLDSESYDLVLLDLNLPDLAGIAAVSALHRQAPGVPIIVYSGADDPMVKSEALKSGAEHYIVKGKESGYSIKFVIENTLA